MTTVESKKSSNQPHLQHHQQHEPKQKQQPQQQQQQQQKQGLPNWHYTPPAQEQRHHLPNEGMYAYPAISGPNALNLGNYRREDVTNVDMSEQGRAYFDYGLRLMLSYQHEMASKCFLACLEYSPHCALAHGLIALCHSPNYNFKGDPYYESACHYEDVMKHDLECMFPSQQVADRHSKAAIDKIEEIRRMYRTSGGGGGGRGKKGGGKKGGRNKQNKSQKTAQENGCDHAVSSSGNSSNDSQPQPQMPALISETEVQLLTAIRVLTCCPGVDPALAEETVGRPYSHALRKVYQKYPEDPEIVYCFAESLMVLNAWQLYEYPSGKPVSPDVDETRAVLEKALAKHKQHAGLCHLYVHLSEMSAHPELALQACGPLRTLFPDAGHLLHMGTHIDVLVGDYYSCVKHNEAAILADEHVMKCSPSTAGTESFYFGYIVHDYHMLVFGAMLGGMEGKAMEAATQLNKLVNEEMFNENEELVAYLESYSALDIHVMVRFGRWTQILQLPQPKNKRLMLYRASTLSFARGLAHAALGDTVAARKEADRLDTFRKYPEAQYRILHNNDVARLLAVDAVMLRGEILYREGKYEEAFTLLRQSVEMQDNLNFDEPWGKMQPIRHALGGLLLEQGHVDEAIEVFRRDLKYHPRNPFALVGLISCLKKATSSSSCCSGSANRGKDHSTEISMLHQQLEDQRCEYSDFNIVVACECCLRA